MAKLHRVLDYMFKLMMVYMDLVQQVDTFEHDFFVMSHFRHGRGSQQKLLPEDLQLRFMNMDGGELGILAVFVMHLCVYLVAGLELFGWR